MTHLLAPRYGKVRSKYVAKVRVVVLSSLTVAPRAGAWIETTAKLVAGITYDVAPRAGAWIETIFARAPRISITSLPARERGLKLAPLGADGNPLRCRSPRGSVD